MDPVDELGFGNWIRWDFLPRLPFGERILLLKYDEFAQSYSKI